MFWPSRVSLNTGFDFASAGSRKISRLVDGAFFIFSGTGAAPIFEKTGSAKLAFLGFDDGEARSFFCERALLIFAQFAFF